MSKLTPEQIRLKQQLVIDHVKEEAVKQGLSAAEAEAMLAQTLEFNGLPQVNSNPITGALDNLFKIGSNTVNKIGLPAPTQTASQPAQDLVPGLPVPGTLEHTVALALFNAQQYINQALSGTSQPAVDNKLGVAAGASEPDGSVLSAVSSLPASLSNAAVQVLKFVNPASKEKTEPVLAGLRPGQSYSEVVTGVDPTYAALGVLTTGALASVAYSYVASDSDIASSASDLALGAVDAIARNDIVQNIANNDLIKKASNAIGSLTGSSSEDDIYHDTRDSSYYYYDYDKLGYSDYDYYNQNYQLMDPKESFSKKDPFYRSDDKRDQSSPPDTVEWYEPATGASEEVPYVAYKEKHNPWALLNQGKPTDHLYRSLD